MEGASVGLALLFTLFAGLATGIGSALAFFTKHTNTKFLSFALGVSAGVMIYISFVELLASSQMALSEMYGMRTGMLYCTLAFFGGLAMAAFIDKMVPKKENPHEFKTIESMTHPPHGSKNLMRTGVLTAIIVAIHNFPEGIATFMAAINSTKIGIAIAIAIAIHNIPEGIAVSAPIYYATGSKRKAFWYSFISGLAEPVGALTAYLLLMPFLSPLLLNLIFAAIAGIMVYISVDELLPAAEAFGEHHLSIYGFIAGMAVMAATLILTA